MDKIIEFLNTIASFEDKALEVKPRVTNTIGSVVKICKAALAADLGNTERAFVTALNNAATKAQALVG